ncbi:ROK family protein [Agrococcus sp. ProA11]|uniref:ROK family protein n=1 Tax=Agrococcus chionoecetis TaxID=3153752 RepID=UPI003260E668
MRVGLDIGGTKTAALLMDDHGTIQHESVRPTGYGATEVIATAVAAAHELAAVAGMATSGFSSVGVGVPGVVTATSGTVSHAVNLGLENLELGSILADRLGTRVHVENDVNAAAVGVYHLLAEPATHSMAYLNLGTGLAAGLVLEGRIWRGSRGTAGEIGHIPVDPDGPLCACGQRGCLELVASGSGIARMWPTESPRPMEALHAAAINGDSVAADVFTRFTQNVAASVRVLVLSVDVDKVVIGGGMSSLGAPLIDAVATVLDAWAVESPFLDSLQLASRVELLPDGYSAAAVGAALVGGESPTELQPTCS